MLAVKKSLIAAGHCNYILSNWVLCRACRPWEAGKATLLLGSIVPIPGRRIPALEQSTAFLEMGLEVSAQAQASGSLPRAEEEIASASGLHASKNNSHISFYLDPQLFQSKDV